MKATWKDGYVHKNQYNNKICFVHSGWDWGPLSVFRTDTPIHHRAHTDTPIPVYLGFGFGLGFV